MAKQPQSWQNHYHGDASKVSIQENIAILIDVGIIFLLEEVKDAIELMINNINSTENPCDINWTIHAWTIR